ncbi:1-acyl-sn-glycerol-3-phosphate acyltransferase [Streptomyces sp. AJS327]|uniref:lysophospholipid acyltransferase family protein n=1 Tax=Streptomyces sp. AJS327 TaxID=2545265 RepID=UPI0015DDC9AC|nr:lysophospholipid acyltransferase family protein [Streptomyces sp. AJS327]MBA0051777.1 1-acyl-sn-glycerol-3-phosphate acyltransferase [Streptomyces sp. AJS327]
MSRQKVGFWYRLAAVLAKPPLLVLFKRDWQGMEHIPAEGGFITVVNHNSYLDPLAYAHFAYNSRRLPRFLAKESLFRGNGLPARFMRGSRQIPVYRESSDAVGAFRAAVDAVESGECVTFYPEGTLTRDPALWPMQGKTGAARVALVTRAPVVPIAQWGAHRVLPPYAKRPRLFPRKTFAVRAGRPVDLSRYYGMEPTAEVLREVTELIMDAITAELAELRGEPAPAERYTHRGNARNTPGGNSAGRPERTPRTSRKPRPGQRRTQTARARSRGAEEESA